MPERRPIVSSAWIFWFPINHFLLYPQNSNSRRLWMFPIKDKMNLGFLHVQFIHRQPSFHPTTMWGTWAFSAGRNGHSKRNRISHFVWDWVPSNIATTWKEKNKPSLIDGFLRVPNHSFRINHLHGDYWNRNQWFAGKCCGYHLDQCWTLYPKASSKYQSNGRAVCSDARYDRSPIPEKFFLTRAGEENNVQTKTNRFLTRIQPEN